MYMDEVFQYLLFLYSIVGINVKIKVTTQEKMIVSNNISNTFFPRLFANDALIKKGNNKNIKKTNINSGIPSPNIIFSFGLF